MEISSIQFLVIQFFRTFQKYLSYAIAVVIYLLSAKFTSCDFFPELKVAYAKDPLNLNI